MRDHLGDQSLDGENNMKEGLKESVSLCRLPDHSPLPSAEVKKMWIYTPIPPYTFMA
jgi:hypothetical protein